MYGILVKGDRGNIDKWNPDCMYDLHWLQINMNPKAFVYISCISSAV